MALLVGPANAGKVARLLDLYLASLDREPVLIVPTRGDVERVERDLLTRSRVSLEVGSGRSTTSSVAFSRGRAAAGNHR